MGVEDDPIFEGNSASEAERFITWIRRKARTEGKLRDKDWMLDLFSSSLGGTALRWYFSLDPTVQNSWDLLQPAILDRWSDSSSPASGPSPTIPTPAAAPSSASALPPRNTGASVERTGFIKVLGGALPTYISRKLDQQWGNFLICHDKAEALKICYRHSDKPHDIKTLNSTGSFEYLGARQFGDGNFGPRCSDHLAITTTSYPLVYPPVSSDKSGMGPAWGTIWNVSPLDGTIRVNWPTDPDQKGHAIVTAKIALTLDKLWLYVVGDYDAFLRDYGAKYCEARLVFEPI